MGYRGRFWRLRQGRYRENWSTRDFTKTGFVRLDVHKDSIVVAVAEAGRSPARLVVTVPFQWKALRRVLKWLGEPSTISCYYEAGPAGYDLARTLRVEGWACDVVAPSLGSQKGGRAGQD